MSSHRDRWFAAGLFLAALIPRTYVALAWAREPVWDGHYYHFGATRIAAGLGYSEDVLIDGNPVWKPWCHYPVGYSGLLGGVYKMFGDGPAVAPLMNAVLGALTAVLVFLLARSALDPLRARLAGALCAAHPGLVLYTALVMTEPLSALTLVLGGVCAALYASRWFGWFGSGVALGLGTLVRPTALLAIPWLLPFFTRPDAPRRFGEFIRSGQARRALVLTVLTGVVALGAILPWTLRNCRVMDGCALVSTNGGWNLAIGAVTETGRFTALKAEWGCPGPGQVRQDACWGEFGKRKIAEDPLAWLSKVPQKLAHTYNHESFAVGYLSEADPERWPEPRREFWRISLTLFHHLLMFGAALSLVSLRWPRGRPGAAEWTRTALLVVLFGFAIHAMRQPESPLFWIIVFAPLVALLPLPGAPAAPPALRYAWGVVLMTSVTHAVFFGDDRYHLTVSPLLCMLAAAALRRPAAPPPPSLPSA